MSEVLNEYKQRKVDWQLKVSSQHPLSYVNRHVDSRNEVLLCVEIPWPLLHLWRQLLEGISGEDANYIDMLNLTVVDNWFILKRDCERIEKLLVKKSSEVKVAYKNTKGRRRKLLDDKLYKLSVLRGEIDSTVVNKLEIKECREEAEMYKSKYFDLEKEKNKLYEDMMAEMSNLERNT